MENLDIRDMIKNAGLYHWEIAQQAGIDETTLCRWLRTELTPDRKQRILDALAALKAAK